MRTTYRWWALFLSWCVSHTHHDSLWVWMYSHSSCFVYLTYDMWVYKLFDWYSNEECRVLCLFDVLTLFMALKSLNVDLHSSYHCLSSWWFMIDISPVSCELLNWYSKLFLQPPRRQSTNVLNVEWHQKADMILTFFASSSRIMFILNWYFSPIVWHEHCSHQKWVYHLFLSYIL